MFHREQSRFLFHFTVLKIIQELDKCFQHEFGYFVVYGMVSVEPRGGKEQGKLCYLNLSPPMKLIVLLDKLLLQLAKQQEHVDSASLVTGSDSVLDLQRSRVTERAFLNNSVWFCDWNLLYKWSFDTNIWYQTKTEQHFSSFLLDGFGQRALLRKNVNKAAEGFNTVSTRV